jgi:hypothetical protein
MTETPVTDAISQLEQLLADERDAIQTLDGVRVLEFARRKESLMASIHGATAESGGVLPAEAAARLRALVPALRQNGILLAHARDILHDAMVAVGVAVATQPHGKSAAQSARRVLSVRG